MSILIKGMEMPESCDSCKLKSCGYCDITNRLIPYDGSRHGDCPLVEVPDEQPDRNAQERYEDLCEYFKDCPDKGMSILDERKEFKAWLERVYWHVVRCNELGRELEKLQSAQPEKRTDKRTETHTCDCISRQDAVDIINGYAERFNGYIGTPNDSEVYAYARGLLLSIERNISALTSAQPEIVRCKDCKFWREHKYAKGTKRYIPFCGFNAIYTKSDDFCSFAERRTDEQT